MSFMFRSVAAARSAAVASLARPVSTAAAPALRFAPRAAPTSPLASMSLRFNSTLPSSSGPSTSSPASGSASDAAAAPRRPAFDFSAMTHLMPSAEHEDDPDAWWRKADHALSRNLGKPGNQYAGRQHRVTNSYATQWARLNNTLKRTGTKDEYRRAQFYERPSERKRRLSSMRARRRFQDEIRKRVHLVQMLQARK